MTDTDWTYRRLTAREVLERVLASVGGLVFILAMFLGPEWSAAGLPMRVVIVASFGAAMAGIALGVVTRRERKAARRSGAASV